nr:MAG TPA: hypothetical protein [Bacteriophage sp.]
MTTVQVGVIDSERAEAACIEFAGVAQSLPARKKRKKPEKIRKRLGYLKTGNR